MIKVKMLDNEYLENTLNGLLNSIGNVTDFQKQLETDEEYMKISAIADSLKELLAGCPEAELMEAYEDALFWKMGYTINVAFFDGIKTGFNLRRFIMDETDQRQQDKMEETP